MSFASGGWAMPCAPTGRKGCPECGTPLDEVPFGGCSTHFAEEFPEHPPELAMDERPFAPADAAQGGPEAVRPWGYAYRYPSFPPMGATVIRFTHGEEVNGSKPIEAIPLYLAPCGCCAEPHP